ncbi:MAG: response regulator [[Ruminococcus] gnavus]|nr:response regulator [Mediterraneibacter gnavus]
MKYEVIIAEDEELILNNLVQKVNAHPEFKVTGSAQTGTGALELVKENLPVLLITDIRMPVMDGMELLTKTRELYPDMHFIIISGFSDFEYAREALHLKVYDYLLKPVSQDDIHETLFRLQKELELEKENYQSYFSEDYTHIAPAKIARLLHEFITTHYQDTLNLSIIAQTMNYSQSYLTKIFLQEYNCTPIKYLNSLRLQKACSLLIYNPELTISQIATLTGYEDQGYFSRTFKKNMGISPLQYRKNHEE